MCSENVFKNSVKQVRFLGFNNLTEIKISEFNSIYPRLYKEIGSEKSTTQDAEASIFFGKTPSFWNLHIFQLEKSGSRQLFYQISGTAELIRKHMVAHNKV